MDYELTERARGLLPVIGALAAWGFEWAWGPPNDDEAIDIGAIFRSIPGLIRPAGETRGLVELVVMGTDGEPQHYAMRVSRGSISISERAAPEADASVSGSQRDWIDDSVRQRTTRRCMSAGTGGWPAWCSTASWPRRFATPALPEG